MPPSTKSVNAFDVIREELPKWWADKSTSDFRQGVGMVVPTDAVDAGLMLMGGPLGKLAKKAGAAMVAGGVSTDAEAGSLIPLVLTKMRKHIPEILEAIRRGSSRDELYAKYGIVANGSQPGDLAIHLPSPSARVSNVPSGGENFAFPLDAAYGNEALYKMVPDLRRMSVISNPSYEPIAGAYYSNRTPRWMLPKTLDKDTSGPGLEVIVGQDPLNTLQDLQHSFAIDSASPGTFLEHEINHALGARGNSSKGADGLPWSDRLEEITAALGAQNVPTPELIKQLDKVSPLGSAKLSPYRQGQPIIGNPSQQNQARDYFNSLEEGERLKHLGNFYAKGGAVDLTKAENQRDPYAPQRGGPSQLTQRYPTLSGFAAGGAVSTSGYNPDRVEQILTQLRAELQ